MIPLISGLVRNCERTDRRSLLKIGSLGGLGITLPLLLRHKALAKEGKSAKAVNCIFIWTLGGTSHHDTFDPKPEAAANVKGPFGVIDTAVPGVKFTEVCPRLAQEANRFSLLRSWNPKNASHGFADQYCMSGRFPNQALTYPCLGSVVSHQMGFRSALPPFVQLGNYVDRTFNGGTAGVLGLEHSPFEIHAEANVDKFNVRDITPPLNMELSRVDRRKQMLTASDKLQKTTHHPPQDHESLRRQQQ